MTNLITIQLTEKELTQLIAAVGHCSDLIDMFPNDQIDLDDLIMLDQQLTMTFEMHNEIFPNE